MLALAAARPPHPDAIPPKRLSPTRYFARNELSRLTQDALRTASWPLTSAEIAANIMPAKGLPAGDVALKEIVAERALTVLAAAHEARGSGEVRKQPECSMGGAID
jgi:hypothetical protein